MSAPASAWTIGAVLAWTTAYFREKGVAEPRASAEVLLAHTLGLTRLDLYLRHDQPLHEAERSCFRDLVRRRATGAPVAYLTGHKEFYSLDFMVTPATLIPRPETEFLVDAAVAAGRKICGREGRGAQPLDGPPPPPYWGLETGVGSGAVVVALAKELPHFRWVGLDVSAEALKVARENIRRHGLAERITLMQSDLLAAVRPRERLVLLVANLPYVPDRDWEQLPGEIRDFEPARALKGGPDGLELIRPLVRQAPAVLIPGGRLLLEVGEGQAGPVGDIIREVGAYDDISTIRDYSRLERVVQARRI